LNQPEKSIIERHPSKLITEEEENYFRQSFEEHFRTKDTSEHAHSGSFDYSTTIPKVIATDKSKI
jgi:hypothetical protein